jgi:hypothetical protein
MRKLKVAVVLAAACLLIGTPIYVRHLNHLAGVRAERSRQLRARPDYPGMSITAKLPPHKERIINIGEPAVNSIPIIPDIQFSTNR